MNTASPTWRERIAEHLGLIYGPDGFDSELIERLAQAIGSDASRLDGPAGPDAAGPETAGGAAVERWSERDAVLITYGDTFVEPGVTPLRTLDTAVGELVGDAVSMVHVLPFAPWSSDDGFSVIDPWAVNPTLGDWHDLENLARNRGLMADLVVNHLSASSAQFEQFVDDVEPGRSWFVTADPDDDLSAVVRPRQHELLMAVETAAGLRHVWCTFSHDQIDVNVANPEVLVELIALVGKLIATGARFVRLDAIAFLWKRIGTSCVHLPETHEFVKLLRTLVDVAAPDVVVLTETNVAHRENISYLANGDEAHMAYNFSLPPLTVLALQRGDASALTAWLPTMATTPPGTTLLSFLACHDGLGVRPLAGLADAAAVDEMADAVVARGGFVSMAATPDGPRPYELNATLWSTLASLPGGPAFEALDVARFLAAHTIMFSVRGIPALYVHAAMASENFAGLAAETGRSRSINRGQLTLDQLRERLATNERAQAVVAGLRHRLNIRGQHRAFHPEAPQEALDLGSEVVALRRTSIDGIESVLALHNVTDRPVAIKGGGGVDVLTGRHMADDVVLDPYECVWLVGSSL